MTYEIKQLSNGYLVVTPGEKPNTLATHYVHEIADALALILIHARDNPLPYGAIHAPSVDSVIPSHPSPGTSL